MRYIIYALTAGLFFAGCSVTVPAVTEYRLAPQVTYTSQQQCHSKSLKILAVKSPSTLKTNQMRYVVQPFKEGSYTQSSWAQSPNKMLQRELYFVLSHSGIFGKVYNYDVLGESKWILEVHLDEFVQYFDTAQEDSFVKIAIDATLYNDESKQVIAKHYFVRELESQSADALGGIDAMNKAFGLILEDIVKWLEGSC